VISVDEIVEVIDLSTYIQCPECLIWLPPDLEGQECPFEDIHPDGE